MSPLLKPVDTGELPEYPISSDVRLDSHYFVPWNLKRWRGSDMRKRAYVSPEVGFYAFELICAAQDETPLGTLPTSDEDLAFLLRMPTDKWRELRNRSFSPLHGWFEVRCDTGEVRLANKVVQLVAEDALKSQRNNVQKQEKRRDVKRLNDLKTMIEQRIGAGQLLKNPGFLEKFDAWIKEHYEGANRTESLVREALDQFTLEKM